MSSFVKQPDVEQEQFDWGTIGWRCARRTRARSTSSSWTSRSSPARATTSTGIPARRR